MRRQTAFVLPTRASARGGGPPWALLLALALAFITPDEAPARGMGLARRSGSWGAMGMGMGASGNDDDDDDDDDRSPVPPKRSAERPRTADDDDDNGGPSEPVPAAVPHHPDVSKCRGSPSQKKIDCCCWCEPTYAACPPFFELDLFENTLTGPPKPARWPWSPQPASAEMGNHGPIYTWILSDGHTGSTALAGLLATSPHVSTLCSSGLANCEGEKILMYKAQHMPLMSKKQRGQMKKGTVFEMNWLHVIREYQHYWNLSKPILMDKSPAFLHSGPQIAQQLRSVGMRTAFIVMSHSCCTTSVHTYALEHPNRVGAFSKLPNPNLYNWNRTNEHLLEVVDRLVASGENVIHVRYEAMVSDPQRFARVLTTFLPELGELDPERNGMADTKAGDVAGNRAKSIAYYVENNDVRRNTCERFPKSWSPIMARLGYLPRDGP